MAVRSTMSDLIARVQRKVSDPQATIFSQQEIQDALDRNRLDVKLAELQWTETVLPGGKVIFVDYFAPNQWGDWEADALIQSGRNWAQLTPVAADFQVGKWSFDPTVGELPPVVISGQTYDIYAAAADLLEEWASKEKLSFDFSVSRQSFSESQKFAALEELARSYRRSARLGFGSLVDTNTNRNANLI